jgi:hypothetical protein
VDAWLREDRNTSTIERHYAGTTPTWEIRVLFDGECPLCVKEVDFLKSKDAGSGRIDFVDIADPSYSPDRNAGLSFEQAMGEIHAILPDGSVVTKVRSSVLSLHWNQQCSWNQRGQVSTCGTECCSCASLVT